MQPQLSAGVGFGAMPHALHRSRGSRGWPLGVEIITIYPYPKALIWRGVWGTAPRLSTGVGFGAMPHALCRSRGSRGWPLGASIITIYPIYPHKC